jgi:hypothetical protein
MTLCVGILDFPRRLNACCHNGMATLKDKPPASSLPCSLAKRKDKVRNVPSPPPSKWLNNKNRFSALSHNGAARAHCKLRVVSPFTRY